MYVERKEEFFSYWLCQWIKNQGCQDKCGSHGSKKCLKEADIQRHI